MNTDKMGCWEHFDVLPFIQAAESLLACDETLRALNLLDNLPAYQRDFPPPEVTALRREIQKRMATPNFYATSRGYELSAHDDSIYNMHKSLRGAMMIKEITRLNEAGFVPHIIDNGPGEYWLPSILDLKNLKFTYFPIYLNHPSNEHYKKRFEKYFSEKVNPSEPVIYFCGEIIEHLHREDELRFEMERHVGLADVIHISTPYYTYDTICKDWKEKADLGHLRAYTPKEFMKTLEVMFPEYRTLTYISQIMHARSVLGSTRFDVVKPDIDIEAE